MRQKKLFSLQQILIWLSALLMLISICNIFRSGYSIGLSDMVSMLAKLSVVVLTFIKGGEYLKWGFVAVAADELIWMCSSAKMFLLFGRIGGIHVTVTVLCALILLLAALGVIRNKKAAAIACVGIRILYILLQLGVLHFSLSGALTGSRLFWPDTLAIICWLLGAENAPCRAPSAFAAAVNAAVAGTEADADGDVRFCAYCGAKHAASASFCERCGKPVAK